MGLLHIYTGEGKGKTTAALGLALRALGGGKRVLIVQFMKGRDTGELVILRNLSGVTILRNSEDYGFFSAAGEETRARITAENNANLKSASAAGESGECDLLILDEAIGAYNKGAVGKSAVERLVRNKPEALELILTGRGAPEAFIRAADYVTEMVKIKHPHDKGIPAREGIEY